MRYFTFAFLGLAHLVLGVGIAARGPFDLAQEVEFMRRQLDDPNVIQLPRTAYSVRPKQSRWRRICNRFTEAAALASVAACVAAVVISTLTPDLFPLPA